MKRILAFLLLVLLLPLPALAEKADSFPAAFLVKYTVKDKLNQQTYLSWEYVETAQKIADDEINGLVDDYIEKMEPSMQKSSNPKRNSRLDVHVVNTRSGQSTVSFLVLARESYLDADGQPMIHPKKKYWKIERTYRDAEHITSEAWFDTEGNPLAISDTHVKITREFDETGNIVEEKTYGPDGEPIARKAGYDEVRREFNEANLASRISYYLNGEPVLTTNEISVICREYDAAGNITAEWYLGTEGEPVKHKKNKYARIEREYLDKDHITYEAWFGTDGKPIKMNKDKYYALRREFDEAGNEAEVRYLNSKGKPVACKAGYEVVRRQYDENNRKISEQYLDRNGEPMADSKGVYGKTFEYDEKGRMIQEQYCNADGEPAPDQDGHVRRILTYGEDGKVSEEKYE